MSQRPQIPRPQLGLAPLLLTLALLLPGSLAPVSAQAQGNLLLQVEALALFPGRALLRIQGREQVLRVGERSAEGIELLAADTSRVEIGYQGQRRTLTLTTVRAPGGMADVDPVVSIALNTHGQYRTAGIINGRPVQFLVDTGANLVTLSQVHAARLGVDYRHGRPGTVITAQGTTEARQVLLPYIQVEGLRVEAVEAVVILGEFPEDVLLGMSFLRHLSMETTAGTMLLRRP